MGDLQSRLEAIDYRLSKIEEFLNYKLRANLGSGSPDLTETVELKARVSGETTESQIGESVFAWISGIVVLFLVIFIMLFFQNKEKPGLAIILGYGATAGVLVFSQMLRKSFPKQVYLLRITSHILLFYVTLWLHFFSVNPFIGSNITGLAVLALPVGYLMYFAFRKNSETLVILGILMVLTTAILSDSTFVMLSLLSLIAVFSIYANYIKGWSRLLHFTVFFVYLTHLFWLIGNPIAGNPLQAVDLPQGSLLYLFSYGFIFSMIALQKPKTGFNQNVVTSITIWNGLLFAGILLFEVSTFYKDTYSVIFAAITLFSLAYSALLKIRNSHFFITAFYAVVSFVAMSVMIYGLTGFPDAYLWLVMQSLLVVSIALWFRTPLIIIANTLMFVGILAFYLVQGDPINSTNIAFAIVAVLTARFLNWKKERLKLKTQAIRNTYLITVFFTTLFALYHLVPAKFITISWVGAAGLFFGLSYILKAKKYRWLAFGTLIVSVIYLFFFQLKSMELGFRIVAFLIIAVITLITSFYYSRRSRN